MLSFYDFIFLIKKKNKKKNTNTLERCSREMCIDSSVNLLRQERRTNEKWRKSRKKSYQRCCEHNRTEKLFPLKQVSWRLFNLPLVNTQSNILFSISVTKFLLTKNKGGEKVLFLSSSHSFFCALHFFMLSKFSQPFSLYIIYKTRKPKEKREEVDDEPKIWKE
jgi:hypothetical protein